SLCLISTFFFFQAEDGIRDFHVTGVQTCALPIFYGDKVMSTVNARRGALPRRRELVSNGEIGIVVGQAKFGRAWDGKTPERLDRSEERRVGKEAGSPWLRRS